MKRRSEGRRGSWRRRSSGGSRLLRRHAECAVDAALHGLGRVLVPVRVRVVGGGMECECEGGSFVNVGSPKACDWN